MGMPTYDWDTDKNERLIRERGLSFLDVVYHIEHGGLLATVDHPNQARRPGQRVFIVCIGDYAYEVPFVIEGDSLVLRTVYPSRKATRDDLR
jgi:uncharacterized DUF497 family protein